MYIFIFIYNKMVKKKLYNPTSLMNYIRCDCICDYLDLCTDTNLQNDNKSLFSYITDMGIEYEKQVIHEIVQMLDYSTFSILRINKIGKSIDKLYKETVTAIQSCKYDLILDGVLINNDNLTYGHPDLIVSTRWINKYISDKIVNDDICVYYIIDIKGSSINLINGGLNISMNKKYEGYKYQVYIYKEALNKIQKYKPKNNYGFILGKNYKYQENGKYVNITNPFKTLGLIDYNSINEKSINYEKNIKDAINYKKSVNKNDKKCKKILKSITNNKSINSKSITNNKSIQSSINKGRGNSKQFINMKNTYDKGHSKIKKYMAYNNKEITAFYKCGIKQREIANRHDIYDYDDKRLTPEKLGFTTKNSFYTIIKNMLKGIHSNKFITVPTNNNVNNWRIPVLNEFFVDFETYNVPHFGEHDVNKLYMIGVGYTDLEYNWKYKCFKLEKMYNYEEQLKIMMNDFISFINSFNIQNVPTDIYYKNIRLYHWSHIERTLFKKKVELLKINDPLYNLPWFDLIEVFRDKINPIIVKDCTSFKLKDIVKKLNEYNLISLKWDDIDDGLLSSYKAYSIYENGNECKNNITLQSIVNYNEIDCKAVNLLLSLIRTY
jgi:hypothetical protein